LLRRASLIAPNAPFEQAGPKDREVAMQISQELGGLALALDQAGAYLEETGCRLQDYQQIYERHRTKLLKERRGLVTDHPEPVATTWSLSFVRVEEKNPAAAELLRFCAFLAPEDIAEEMIAQGARHLGPLLEPVAGVSYELNQAIEVLRAYSLVQRDPSIGALSIHRLVQAVLRDAMPAEAVKLWAERTACMVNAAFPDVEFGQWSTCERCLPHAQACCCLMELEQMSLSEVADLLTKMGGYLLERGQYQEAEDPLRQALMLRERNLGSDHLDTAQSLSVLGGLYYVQGKYKQAEPLCGRALAIWEKQLGPGHPNTATGLNNLAALYHAQGKYEQVEPLYQRALAVCEKQLGPEHPDVATGLYNLSEFYRAQGKYEQAEPFLKRALAVREKQLGPEHPSTANSLNFQRCVPIQHISQYVLIQRMR
jgi:tetratricopeptide (TPR) repeat protein